MMKRLSDMNSALPGLLIGVVLFGAVSQLIGIFLVTDKVGYSLGLWIGVILAIYSAVDMAVSLNSAMDRDEKGAQALMTKRNIIRYLVVVLALGSLMITKCANPLAAFLGAMGLKVSAYLQPIFTKFKKKTE